MGSDKALISTTPGGPPLYRRVAELLGTVAGPVMLAPGTRGRLGETGYMEVADDRLGAGPLAGLVSALEAAPCELLAVVAVDMPSVNPGVLSLLAGLCGECDAAVPVVNDAAEPLHAVYARRALPLLTESLRSGRCSLRGALEALRVRWVGPELWGGLDAEAAFAANLNSYADVEEWREGRGSP